MVWWMASLRCAMCQHIEREDDVFLEGCERMLELSIGRHLISAGPLAFDQSEPSFRRFLDGHDGREQIDARLHGSLIDPVSQRRAFGQFAEVIRVEDREPSYWPS